MKMTGSVKAGCLYIIERVNKRGMPMSNAPDLMDALLDSWQRNNTILVNLLRAIPKSRLEAKAMQGSPSIAELFGQIHYVRLIFITADVPELAVAVPREEWEAPDPDRMAQLLNDSAKAVRDAVKSRVEAGHPMDLHYDHPILLLQ